MPAKKTIKKAQSDKRAGKSPTTQAGEFVKEEIENIRKGKHGAKNAKQAIAIGLSEARRAGVDLPPIGKKPSAPKKPKAIRLKKASPKRSKAAVERLKKEPSTSVSHRALSRQAHSVARKKAKSR